MHPAIAASSALHPLPFADDAAPRPHKLPAGSFLGKRSEATGLSFYDVFAKLRQLGTYAVEQKSDETADRRRPKYTYAGSHKHREEERRHKKIELCTARGAAPKVNGTQLERCPFWPTGDMCAPSQHDDDGNMLITILTWVPMVEVQVQLEGTGCLLNKAEHGPDEAEKAKVHPQDALVPSGGSGGMREDINLHCGLRVS